MLSKEIIQRTKMFFQKKLQELKSFFLGGYQKLPRSLSFRPFSCSGRNKRRDNFYTDFYDEWEADLNCVKKQNDENMLAMTSKEPLKIDDDGVDACSGSFMKFAKRSPAKIKQEGKVKEKNKGGNPFGKREDFCSKKMKNHDLANKMKEFEIMNSTDDVEQVLDIEEALHYYSRLTSPVYLDIVDKFFTDMHSEYSMPQATVTLNAIGNSKRRFGSIRL